MPKFRVIRPSLMLISVLSFSHSVSHADTPTPSAVAATTHATVPEVSYGTQALYPPGGGFTGPINGNIMTAARAKLAWDDTPVTLRGRIVRGLGGERYEFQDESGTVVLDIDHDKWYGLQIGPSDTVVVYGEIDREYHRVEVDVKQITKAT